MPTPWPLWVTFALVVGTGVYSLLVGYLSYRVGVRSGEKTLSAYKDGATKDGGCFVKAQVGDDDLRQL